MKKETIILVFFILLFADKLFAEKICITNFNKLICDNFKTTPNVIVKTPLSKIQLSLKLQKTVKQIAFLGKNNLYLIATNSPVEYAQKLSTKDYMIYAQPDIVQKRNNSGFENHIPKNYYNLKNLWLTSKGEGVKIAIIDDGFNLSHEDLDGVKISFSYDADVKNLNVFPKYNLDIHGTQVAGVIFAQHNNIGIDGIAPRATIIPIRQTTNKTSDTIVSFTVADKVGADIVNCSWNSPVLLEPVYDVIKYLAYNGRQGKGTAIVFAAGNNSKEIKPFSIEASIAEVITVGAIHKYSNYGDMVDFILPANIRTLKKNGSYGNFSGTSASASVISGLMALIISQNKEKPLDELIALLKKEVSTNSEHR